MSLLLRKIGYTGLSTFAGSRNNLVTRTLCAAASLDSKEIDKLVKNNKVVVFMKGNPDAPRCGFSNAVVQILRMHSVQYDSHDVLSNEALRQGIKDYSNWPTIPQIFINGEFVGGCDIMLQMHQNGELVEELKKVGIKSALVMADESGENQKK
ncbi:uncharacterized monothiol glutaredoxin ycf64-like [Uranotaenia lowii]|uniref:uncharacterized monothiol glutaredoxin ycf64-like n=1 Tax=Uranotaenia lowii TaxID=190385 RepID=UPI00247B162E|nr:uncharacterized monothiol glutaredoxin ycf64-like [Uranotaenia lowii]